MSLNSLFDPNYTSEKNYIIDLLDKAKKQNLNGVTFIDELTSIIENDESKRLFLIQQLNKIFSNINFISYLVDSGIHVEDGILSVFRKRVVDLLLPEIEDNNELTSLVNDVFYDSKRFQIISSIPKDRWTKFFTILAQNMPEEFAKKKISSVKNSLLQAMLILSDRVSGGFSGKEMIRYSSEVNYLGNPFSVLGLHINKILLKPDASFDILEIKECISNCRKLLDDILTQKDYKGISLDVAAKINRIQQQLTRLQVVLSAFNDIKNGNLIAFYSNSAKSWTEYYSPKKWMNNQLSSTLYLITFLVTYHNGKTGEKYITTTAKEYVRMFWTACGGGLIVAILCFIKTAIGNVPDSSPFFKGFFFSVNYAIGFTTIYLLHWTLATKQPSMTAARIARALVPASGTDLNVKDFTTLFAQLCRSQLIAILGNVIAGFSIALLIFLFLDKVLGIEVLKYSKAYHYWEEVVIMDPKIFYFGGIAGIFLFISGVISGITINNQRFYNIPERIYHHPLLVKFFNANRRRSISNWFERNNGGIVGNIAFGFMMGFAFLIGDILGVPFDIRHITFAAGNFAIGIGGMDYHFTDKGAIFMGFISVFLIGWCNFIVSFVLSLMLAFRSNNLPIYKMFPMFINIIKAFFRNPLPFFIPPLWTKSKEEA
ncbi:site-specific recombinase [Faecalibacter bovis]|uniref:Site-specific recombinase Gcr n=1 Tax=Faecalibacter bovis TaxID=2898187 RepID=A0ABX7XEI9_9FLAO|nr:site-specific recombinase [Faecalibacter bovis]MBS7333631.1 site-specific recombinase Gcr [Weeksellaceae bacterium]QTV06266.1 site-specific recombinase Gcr [Faecalibacter bovis]